MKRKPLIIVRGGGDIATGAIHRLWSAGFLPVVLETGSPSAIRRQVSVCEAVYEGKTEVENMTAQRAENLPAALLLAEKNIVPVVVDPKGESIKELCPDVVVDAVLAKKNMGTAIDMAPLTIALGPGFRAGVDVRYVVETKRGHNLGRIIIRGCAFPNTGIPGSIEGYTSERVIYSPAEGVFMPTRQIGDVVGKGDVIAYVSEKGNKTEVRAGISGIIRGMLRDGFEVTKGFKSADIDPRISELENCFTISDKASCIGGSVLELVCAYANGGIV